MKKLITSENFDFTSLFLICALCTVGLFHTFTACAAGVILCVYLFVYAYKNDGIRIYFNFGSLAVLLITLGYLVSTLWATDSGAAVVGFFKFLPLLLFLAVVMQQKKNPEEYLKIIPVLATVMTVASAVLMQFDSLSKWFSVAGRIAGFFQYSNTFALFVLMALIVIATKEKISIFDVIMIPVLLFGIVYSGSRTVFALLVVAILGIVIFSKNKKFKIVLLVGAAVVIAAAVIYAYATDNFSTVGRFLTTSLTESTFVARLLYWVDALPLVLKHPFGTGYLGYYYMQHSVQTGVYTVKYIHNEFMQLLLDVGWIPTLVFIVAIVKSFFKKGTSLRKRLLLLVVSAHAFFDFDFQFLSMFMLFILLLDLKDGSEKKIQLKTLLSFSLTALLSLLFVYIGLSQTLTYLKKYEAADKIYPWNTENHIELLKSVSENSEKEEYADKIIKNNGYVAVAYDAKAKLAYTVGNFEDMIKYEEMAIEVSPFTYSTYKNYCYMLIKGISLYTESGETYSAEYCKKTLISVAERLSQNEQNLSKLGSMIKDQPYTSLPDSTMSYIQEIIDEQ